MYTFIYFIAICLINLNFHSPICIPTSPIQISPFDISSQLKATYINLDIHSSESIKATITIKAEEIEKHLSLEGNFGELILDENINFMYGESTIQTIYSCIKMRFYMQSINKFWIGQHAVIEIIIECKKTKEVGAIHSFTFHDSLLISIPLLIIDNKTPNSFIEAIGKAISENKSSFDFLVYDFDKIFLENDDLNQNTQFYFFNANNPLQCPPLRQSTWIVLNKFIKISTVNMKILEAYFATNNLNNDLKQYYSTKEKVTLDIKRNFYISENFSQFEYQMLLLSQNNADKDNKTVNVYSLNLTLSFYAFLIILVHYILL